jgi:hypothetical protein
MTVLPESGPVFHWFLPTRGDSDTPGVIPEGDTVVPPGRQVTDAGIPDRGRQGGGARRHPFRAHPGGPWLSGPPGCSARWSPRGRTGSVSSSRSGPAWRHRRWPSSRRYSSPALLIADEPTSALDVSVRQPFSTCWSSCKPDTVSPASSSATISPSRTTLPTAWS